MPISGFIVNDCWYGQLKFQWNKLLAKLVESRRTPNTLEKQIKIEDLSPDTITHFCSTYHKETTEDLDWPKVLQFVLHEINSLNFLSRLAALSIALVLLGMLIKQQHKKSVKHKAVTSFTEEETEERIILKKSTQFTAAQKAMLQFQKNNSDPLVFRYSYGLCEFDDIETNEHVYQTFERKRTKPSKFNYSQPDSLPRTTETMNYSDDVSYTTTPIKKHAKSGHLIDRVELCTPKYFRQNIPHFTSTPLSLSVSPIKTSSQTTKLSSEQANAEPFTF